MLVELALALEIQRTNPTLSEKTAKQYAQWVLEEAAPRALDPWLFHAIIYKESRWIASVSRVEPNGTCSIGLGQINVNCESSAVYTLRNPRTNLRAMGKFLEKIRSSCRARCEGLGWVRSYNSGNPRYLSEIQKRVELAHARY